MSSFNYQYRSWKIILLTWLLGVVVLSLQEITLAQTQPANPLEVNQSDPLIPDGYGKRPLTSFEKYRIEKAIVDLNQTAQAELERGNADRAFTLWYRQLRLTRVIDTSAEIKALGEIGAIAWQENRGADVLLLADAEGVKTITL